MLDNVVFYNVEEKLFRWLFNIYFTRFTSCNPIHKK